MIDEIRTKTAREERRRTLLVSEKAGDGEAFLVRAETRLAGQCEREEGRETASEQENQSACLPGLWLP